VIRFRAERGYTSIRTHRVRAEVRSWPRLRCRFLRLRQREPGEDASLHAFSPRAPAANFSATRFEPETRPRSRRIQFDAGVGDSSRAMAIFRSVSVAAGPSTFRQPEPETAPERLLLAPPRPFSGTARVERTPESTFTWSGSLRLHLPGIDPVKLTSPNFAAFFCAQRGCAAQLPEDFLDLP
jgi:hypothetical protein